MFLRRTEASKVRVATLNIKGLSDILTEVLDIMDSEYLAILCMQETAHNEMDAAAIFQTCQKHGYLAVIGKPMQKKDGSKYAGTAIFTKLDAVQVRMPESLDGGRHIAV